MSKVVANKCDICDRTDDRMDVALYRYKRKKMFRNFLGEYDKSYNDFDICTDCMREIQIKMKTRGEKA